MLKGHKDLDVWKKSIDLVEYLYKLTKEFPKEEAYSLTSQIRRSVVSIPSNIAEGAARNSKKEYVQFLYIALGSAAELETQLIISARLGYLNSSTEFLSQLNDITKMLVGLISYLKRKN
ncbi:MAG: four helix bundle protein [Victivallales bacterium]|jgi:four helix bundle protein